MDSECWWIDESWPGPSDAYEIELFQAFEAVGRAYGKTIAQINAGMVVVSRQVGKAFDQIIEGMQPLVAIMDEVYSPYQQQPNLNKNGPRKGSQFDHRGRRRW